MIPLRPTTDEVHAAGDLCPNCGQAMVRLESQFFWRGRAYSGITCTHDSCSLDVYSNATDNYLAALPAQ